jgi:hypothetical protein
MAQQSQRGISLIRQLTIILTILMLSAIGYFVYVATHNSSSFTNTKINSNANIFSAKAYWIMSLNVVNEMSANAGAMRAIAGDVIFVIMNTKGRLSTASETLNTVPVEDFTSEAKLESDIVSNSIRAGTKAILYDNEPWSYTPVNEQENIFNFYKTAATLAHAHGYIFIATPVSKIDANIDVQISPYVNVLDIQSQYDQATASGYSAHVLPIAKAARQVNAKDIILSGLSTNPRAGIPTPGQLVSDAKSVRPEVQGYWLNIPAAPADCLTMVHPSTDGRCAGPQPQVGIAFLAQLGPVQ